MNRRYRKRRNTSKVKEFILSHIENNLKEYTIVSIFFIIGIIIGVIFINNISENQLVEISEYITSHINELKENRDINSLLLLKESVKRNIFLCIFLWFMGSTVIGMSIVYLTICFRGFCLGYTISSIVFSLGIGKGILFSVSSQLFQNIIFIPCILALAVSGKKLHNSIMEDRRKENIKVEILRHTVFSVIILAILIISSLTEVYISKNLIFIFIKYI